jgi:hypothetical protein
MALTLGQRCGDLASAAPIRFAGAARRSQAEVKQRGNSCDWKRDQCRRRCNGGRVLCESHRVGMDVPARSGCSPTHGSRRIGMASDGIHRVESNQVIDPHQLGYFTDSLTGSKGATSGCRRPTTRQHNRRRGCAGSVERWYGASPQHPVCLETGGVGMPTDPGDRSPINTEFLLEHTKQHQHQSFLRLQFGGRDTGPDRYV